MLKHSFNGEWLVELSGILISCCGARLMMRGSSGMTRLDFAEDIMFCHVYKSRELANGTPQFLPSIHLSITNLNTPSSLAMDTQVKDNNVRQSIVVHRFCRIEILTSSRLNSKRAMYVS